MFQLSWGAGGGCTVVPWTKGGGTRFRQQGEAANRGEIGDEAQPFRVEPVETGERAWGRVEKRGGGGLPEGWVGMRLESL